MKTLTIALLLVSSLIVNGQKIVQKNNLTTDLKNDYTYVFTEATKQQLFGNFSQAVYLYRQCILGNPNHAPSYYQLSRIISLTDDKNLACNFAKKAYDLDPTNYWYSVNLAQNYINASKNDSAIWVLEKYTKIDNSNSEVALQLISLYTQTKQYKKSLKLIDKNLEQYGESEDLIFEKYRVYVYSGKYNKAIDLINSLLEKKPDDIKLIGILAELYVDIKKFDLAKEYYDKLFKLDPNNVLGFYSVLELYSASNDTTNFQSMCYKILFQSALDYNEKLKFLNNIVVTDKYIDLLKGVEKKWFVDFDTIQPNNEVFKTVYSDYLLKQRMYPEASVQIHSLINLNRENYIYWERLLYVENVLSHSDSVISIANKALTIFTDKPFIYLLKGMSLYQINNYDEAISVLSKGLKIGMPSDFQKVQFYSFLGESYYKLDDFKNASVNFDKALEIDSLNIYILNNYSYYLSLKESNLPKAYNMSLTAVKLDPHNSTYLDTHAWVLYQMKKYDQALKIIEQAIKYDSSNNPEIFDHYADILYCNGLKEQALKNWKIAINFGQNKDEVERKISNFECK